LRRFQKWHNPPSLHPVSLFVHAKKCKNQKDYSLIKSLHDYYSVWTKHGERGVIVEDGEDDNIPDWTQEGAFADYPMGEDNDAMGETQGADDALDDLSEVIREYKQPKKFECMLEDHKKPLCPNCKEGHKKLHSTLKCCNGRIKMEFMTQVTMS
jgi:hypothetical protein